MRQVKDLVSEYTHANLVSLKNCRTVSLLTSEGRGFEPKFYSTYRENVGNVKVLRESDLILYQ